MNGCFKPNGSIIYKTSITEIGFTSLPFTPKGKIPLSETVPLRR